MCSGGYITFYQENGTINEEKSNALYKQTKNRSRHLQN